MKYIAYWEADMEKLDELVKKNAELIAIYEKGTDVYPKVKYGPYNIISESGNRGFVILDVDDPKQLVRWNLHYAGLSEWTFVPIYSTAKATDVYLKAMK